MKRVEDRYLQVTMLDGSKWNVPVRVIAEDRAKYYAEKDNITFEESLHNDTLPLFEGDNCEIMDWASNNMNWEDVQKYAVKVDSHPMAARDLQEGWVNGDKKVVDP